MDMKTRQRAADAVEDDRVGAQWHLFSWSLAPRIHPCPIMGEEYPYEHNQGATLDWTHLSSLVNAASEEIFPGLLPHNINNLIHAGVAPGAYPRFVSKEGASEVVGQVFRFIGWLRAAATLPGLRRVVVKTQSPNGVCSPRTTVGLWDLHRRFPSPGGLERKLWAVRRRADRILEAYEGQNTSWASVANALLVSDRVGKAAVIAVAIHLSVEPQFRMYRDARSWLVDYHACVVDEQSEGIAYRREAEPRLQESGVAVYRIALPRRTPKRGQRVGTQLKWLVRSDEGRTHHCVWSKLAQEALEWAVWCWSWEDSSEIYPKR